MPNWTFNRIKIKGSEESIKKFLAASKNEEGHYHFGSWFPIPETFTKYDTTNYPNGEGLEVGKTYGIVYGNPFVATKELIEEYKQATKEQSEKYGCVGWYDWNVMNYGCKWDCEVIVEDNIGDTLLYLYCETPWCAPVEFLKKLSALFPDFVIKCDSEYEDGDRESYEYNCGEEM